MFSSVVTQNASERFLNINATKDLRLRQFPVMQHITGWSAVPGSVDFVVGAYGLEKSSIAKFMKRNSNDEEKKTVKIRSASIFKDSAHIVLHRAVCGLIQCHHETAAQGSISKE